MKNIALLGSTGSIGVQTLQVISNFPDKFNVVLLSAHKNIVLLAQQIKKFNPKYVVVTDPTAYKKLLLLITKKESQIHFGIDKLSEIISCANIDIVVSAIVGFSGLLPTISAIKSNKTLALANKETLVVAGALINNLLKRHPQSSIIPIDSEHSAIFQCLIGEEQNRIETIYLTASGGPFKDKTLSFLKTVTKKQALNHPNWVMGDKITIDSATMMNKGLEMIEAKWLFNLSSKQIKIIVHAQSIIHSMVKFEDGSLKAQMGLPDMKLPIQYALTYPKRLASNSKKFNFIDYPKLTFEPPKKHFTNIQLAYKAIEIGGNKPASLNAINEETVSAFLNDKISFNQISEINARCLEDSCFIKNPNLEELIETDKYSREMVKKYYN